MRCCVHGRAATLFLAAPLLPLLLLSIAPQQLDLLRNDLLLRVLHQAPLLPTARDTSGAAHVKGAMRGDHASWGIAPGRARTAFQETCVAVDRGWASRARLLGTGSECSASVSSLDRSSMLTCASMG